jgi:hypothetical protein
MTHVRKPHQILCLLVLFTFPSLAVAQEETASIELPRPATTATEETPSWFSVGAAYRFRFENREASGFREGNDDGYGLSQILIDIGIKPTSWLNFHFQGQDARAPGKENANGVFRDPFDVRQAWVEIGDPKKGWIHARVGRQELLYGGQRLIGPLAWTNTARQFDAAKVTVGKDDLGFDVFAASVVQIDPTGFNRHRDENNLHGIYGRLNRLVPGSKLEAFILLKTTPLVISGNGTPGDADTYTAGVRFVRKLAAGFDTEMEAARQFGTFGVDDISAWGGYWVLGYTPDGVKLSPRFSVEYQYGSGDSDPTDGKYQTFDQLFPTGHLYQGTADRVGWRNISDVRAGVAIKPHPKVNLKFDHFTFWLADRHDDLYAVNGSVAVAAPEGGATDKYVGQEVDAILSWKPVSHVTFGGGVGYFMPGQFLKETTPGDQHTFSYLFLNYIL